MATSRRSSRRPSSADRSAPLGLEVDCATSERLGRVRQHGTAAELAVRSALRRAGAHYRTRNRDLAGSPDIANRAAVWAVFVHGCFWHRHEGCPRTTTPTRNRAFWLDKFHANIARDERVQSELRALGFGVLVIWECETKRVDELQQRVADFLKIQAAKARKPLPRTRSRSRS